MSFIKNIFGKKNEPIKTNTDFWIWFRNNERKFFKAVKNNHVEKAFFDKLSPKLNQLHENIFYLTGMYNDHTVELIFTPDGAVKNIVFIEELVSDAPKIVGWKFSALKPEHDISKIGINMDGYVFNSESLSFYANDFPDYPDEIDITVIHQDFDSGDKSTITNGTFIFLDNYLGEYNFVTTIDHLNVIGTNDAKKECIPIEKLKAFLIWRQKEFLEKYEGKRYNTENDEFSGLEAELKNGRPYIAIVNTTLLEWDSKASHPWIMSIEIKYNGDDNNGFPDENTYELLNMFENEILEKLKDFDGYLNVGRQTADNTREIYFACNDFRKSSKVVSQLIDTYANRLHITYDIYKDKYWQSFNRFRAN